MSPKVNRFPEKLLTFFGKSLEHAAGRLNPTSPAGVETGLCPRNFHCVVR